MFRNARSLIRRYLHRGFKTSQRVLEISADPPSFTIRSLTKPFLFTASVCSCSFCGAMIWNYEHAQKTYMDRIGLHDFQQMKHELKEKMSIVKEKLKLWWNARVKKLTRDKVVLGIITCNLVILFFWRMSFLGTFMTNFFTSSPLSRAPCWSLLFSVFSHKNPWHFAINMYCLWMCSPYILDLYGKEQFLAFYISSGVLASFAGFAINVLRSSSITYLGASGAIMAMIGSFCITHPGHILTVPFTDPLFDISFTADTFMKGKIVFDVVGLLMGLTFCCHAAHLSGMLLGIWYVKYGQNMIWGNREIITKKWHYFKNSHV